jgi:cytochrome c oxidase subunit 2
VDIFNFTRLPALSSFAGQIDDVIGWVTVAVGFWFIVSEIVFFYFILRYRKQYAPKASYITGEEKELKRWITGPHAAVLVFDVFIVVIGVKAWVDVKQSLPPEPVPHVRVVAQQWAWSFVHPGLDGQLDTADDIKTVDDLHIQANQKYIWELEARDVLHSFSIPSMRLKQDAVPGRVIRGWLDANAAGIYEIQCAEICGIGHALMPARIVIETPDQHAAWMASQSPISVAALDLPRAAQE